MNVIELRGMLNQQERRWSFRHLTYETTLLLVLPAVLEEIKAQAEKRGMVKLKYQMI